MKLQVCERHQQLLDDVLNQLFDCVKPIRNGLGPPQITFGADSTHALNGFPLTTEAFLVLSCLAGLPKLPHSILSKARQLFRGRSE